MRLPPAQVAAAVTRAAARGSFLRWEHALLYRVQVGAKPEAPSTAPCVPACCGMHS